MAYTQDQYLGFAEQLAPYLSDPTQLMQQAGKLGLGVEDVAKAAQTFNPNITASQIQGYFQPAGITYQPKGALPTSDTYTEDRYNPNDPASSRYIADPNAGRYVFDPATGKHTLVTGKLTSPIDDLSGETELTTGVKPGVDFRADTTAAENFLMAADPNIQQAFFKPGSSDRYNGTFVETFKVENGKLTPIQANAQDIASGNVLFYVGGAPGGDYAGQNRVAQAYMMKDGKLTPVGEAKSYTVPKETPFFKEFLIEGVLPMLLTAAGGSGFAEALGGTLSGGALTGASAATLGSGALNLGAQLLRGVDPMDAIKTTVLTGGVNAAANSLGALLPAEFAAAGKNILTQLITTGKINPVALATSVGMSAASDVIAAETGLDKATAGRLLNAGYQAAQGNLTGATTSLLQSGVLGSLAQGSTSGMSPQDRAAFLDANASPLGLSALSPIAAEDEQIALLQRQNAANQALSDYLGPGNDLSREGLVSQLQKLGLTSDQAEGYAKQADQRINMQRVGADVMSRYSKIDPEFGMPQLDRDTATQELVAAGFTSDRANEILNGIDAQNAIKLENRLSVQSAYQNFTQGKGSEDQLRSALTSAGYNDAQINELVTRGRGVIAGSQLTGGEQAQERASLLPDIRGEIAGKSNFNEAYALAREKLGADATFTWQGKTYSTATAAERPDLSGATSKPSTEVPYIAPNGMHNRAAFIQAGGGTSDADYAKYVNAVNALISEGKSGTLITPASVNSAGKDLPPTTGPVTMEKPKVDSVLGSVVAQGVASFGANSIAGALSALGFTDAGRSVLDKANQIAAAATAAEGADITQGKKDINAAIQKVGESSGIKDFATNVGNLVSTAFNNPKAFGATVGSEVVEEVLQLATVKFPGSFLVKETVASALENGGAAYNTEYESQIAKGASKEDAHLAAQKAAGTAAGVTVALAGGAAGLGKVAGKVFGSQADEAASGVSQVGKTTLKESAQEVLEEGSIAGSIDLALGRPVDAVNALTNMTGGALYGGVTAGSMQGTKLDTLDQAASTSIGSGVQASFNDTLAQTGNIAQASSGSVTTAINNGLDPGAAVSSVISTAAQSGGDMSAVISSSIDTGLSAALSSGVDTSEAVTTIVSGSITSSLSSGVDVTTAIDSTVGSSVKTGIANGADASAVVGSSVNSAVSTSLNNGANASTAVASSINSAISTALNNGADASTVVTGSVNSAVSTALNNGASTSTVVTGAVSSAVTSGLAAGADASTVVTGSVNSAISTALNNGASASTVVTGAVSSAVTSGLNAGADASSVIASSVTAAISTATQNVANSTAVVAGSTSTAVSTAIASGVDASTAISSAVGSATQAGADASTASASSITAAIAAGTDTNTAIAAVTGANSNITANSTTNNNVTSTTATDATTGVTSQTVVDNSSGASTTITTNNNVTSQVTTVGSTTTTVTSDTSTGVITQSTVDGTRTTDVTVDPTTNVTTQVVTDTATNTKVTVEWKPDGEVRCTFRDRDGQETVFDDIDVGDPPKVDIVAPLEPVKPEVKPETPKETKPKVSQSGSGSAMMMPAMAGAAAAVDWLGPQFLKSKERGGYVDPLAEFQALQQQADQQQTLSQIQPELANVLTERGAMPYYAYGQEPSIDEVLGLPDQESSSYNESDYVPVFKSGGKVSPLNIQMMYAKGGHAREDFRDGKHVAGPGDGQSDDIPAWLADGEFVFPADVVSALGNGSTKAGTEKLYEMMHEIRGRARSKHPKDLPPPAHKSPLDYLKKGK